MVTLAELKTLVAEIEARVNNSLIAELGISIILFIMDICRYFNKILKHWTKTLHSKYLTSLRESYSKRGRLTSELPPKHKNRRCVFS